jgi:hypothetical protein
MFQFVKMKSLCSILAALLFLQMTPAYALAQQKPSTSKPSTAKPADTQKPSTGAPVEAAKPTPPPAEPEAQINVGGRTSDGWPIFGDGFLFEWDKPGANPAIPLELVPGYGKGTEEQDKEILRSMILGEKGFEEASRLHDLTIKLSLYDGIKHEVHQDHDQGRHDLSVPHAARLRGQERETRRQTDGARGNR